MSAIPSDEVAEDYRNSLDDLLTNDRYAISNLTLIANENIEHAEAISRVLQNHIQRVPPPRKLPALYVLDSIVKNVGTPYTVYFGRNLHTIFMLAYSQVDQNVRRKMEETLKTWREPVPGSLSTMPVFPTMSTQPIVDALNRFRAAVPQPRPASRPQNGVRITQPQYVTPPPNVPYQYNQQQQQPLAQQPYSQYPQSTYQPPAPQYQTHTPQPQYQTPTPQLQYQAPIQQPQYNAPTPQPNYPPPTPAPQYQQIVQPPQPTSSSGAIDMKKLHADIEDLTIDAKIECSTAPMDQGAQKKLASLQSLKELLDSSAMSETDLVAIRDSVMQQMAKKMAPHRPTPPIPQSYHGQYSAPQAQQHYPVQQPQQPPPQSSTPSLINSANLAELLRTTANRGQPQNGATPTILFPHGNAYTSTPPVQHANPAPAAAENPFLAQLRASGLLSGLSTPPTGSTTQAGTPSATYEPPVQFTTASIRTPRPGLLQSFLSRNPNQCTTCGRRFASDDIGKEKKARHLDWHFKTKTRMLEAERRGVSRSWYVDEREWIASREVDDDQEAAKKMGENGNGKATSTTGQQQDWVIAPTDPAVRNVPCPIDQEGWKSEWSEEVQDFVWRDAVRVGGRYYHATCYRDVMKGRAERVSTPDSVLGKRGREEEEGEGSVGGSGVKKERFKLEV